MPQPNERQVIRDAMDRLLEGKPIRSSGALNIVSLAEEADVKRHALTHKHTDLKDEFYARIRAQGQVPQSEVALREKVTQLEATVATLREDKATLTEEVAHLRRMNNVLAVEKAKADEALRASRTGRVTSIYGDLPEGLGDLPAQVGTSQPAYTLATPVVTLECR